MTDSQAEAMLKDLKRHVWHGVDTEEYQQLTMKARNVKFPTSDLHAMKTFAATQQHLVDEWEEEGLKSSYEGRRQMLTSYGCKYRIIAPNYSGKTTLKTLLMAHGVHINQWDDLSLYTGKPLSEVVLCSAFKGTEQFNDTYSIIPSRTEFYRRLVARRGNLNPNCHYYGKHVQCGLQCNVMLTNALLSQFKVTHCKHQVVIRLEND